MDADDTALAGAAGPALTIGSTSGEIVRILVDDVGCEVPVDFEPDDAEEIAGEVRLAAARAAAGRNVGARSVPASSARSEGRRR